MTTALVGNAIEGRLVLAEAHPEYPIYFCFGCGTHSTVDLVALRAWSAR